jgi:putative endonuclease
MERTNDPRAVDHRTPRRQAGDVAEARVADALRRRGWVILARQVRVDRAELDIVALDPGPPASVVVVEVRSRRSPCFGTQEERLDEAKLHRLYRAMTTLRARGHLPGGAALPHGLEWRVDLVALDGGAGRLRHLRGLIAR